MFLLRCCKCIGCDRRWSEQSVDIPNCAACKWQCSCSVRTVKMPAENRLWPHRDGGISVGNIVSGIVAKSAAVVEGDCVCLIVQVIVIQVCARLEHWVHPVCRQIRTCRRQVTKPTSGPSNHSSVKYEHKAVNDKVQGDDPCCNIKRCLLLMQRRWCMQ